MRAGESGNEEHVAVEGVHIHVGSAVSRTRVYADMTRAAARTLREVGIPSRFPSPLLLPTLLFIFSSSLMIHHHYRRSTVLISIIVNVIIEIVVVYVICIIISSFVRIILLMLALLS